MRHTREAIEDARTELENVTRRYLLERGWNYTSQTPGCYWMWQKKLPDGRDALVDQQMALNVQDWLDNHTPAEASPGPEMPSIEAMIVIRTIDMVRRLRQFFAWDEIPRWVESPQKTLADRKPIDLIVTEMGYVEVDTVLQQLETSAHI